MSTITEWITVQIDADEQAAKAAAEGPWTVNQREDFPYPTGHKILGAPGIPVAYGVDLEDADHIARHDPARVLALCEALREIVGIHKPETGYDSYRGTPECRVCAITDASNDLWPCPTIIAVASIFGDRHGFGDWR